MPEMTNGETLRLKRGHMRGQQGEPIENPVKRYLRDRWVGHGLNQNRQWVNPGRRMLRPAT